MTAVFTVIDGPDLGRSFYIDAGQTVSVGRSATSDFQINDVYISRSHFEIEAVGDKTTLINRSKNGTKVNRVPVQEHELLHGDVIQIGKTQIEFGGIDPLTSERVFKRKDLQSFEFGDAAARLEILSVLPETISESRGDQELAIRLAELLLKSIPDADSAIVARYQVDEATSDKPDDSSDQDTHSTVPRPTQFEKPMMIKCDTRDGQQIQPSRRLMARTFEEGESVLHVWTQETADAMYTMSAGVDWAFCTPIQGEACQGWCFYISGRLAALAEKTISAKLLGHLRFAELVAQFIGAVRHVQLLQTRQSTMQQFFSPRVIETLSGRDNEIALQPREGMVSVLFCDVRGFSRQVEKSEHQLPVFLERVSNALGVMTQSVMRQAGVIADFQGDAVLAFWGWPEALSEGPLPACRAALDIYRQFARSNLEQDHPLNGFQVGIGIGHGRAIAGKIGTQHQAKVGVFGSVVNLASRLEGMTKRFHAPILVDENAATVLRQGDSNSETRCRVLGHFLPKGMQRSVWVYQLIALDEADPHMTDAYIAEYESAVRSFFKGNWSQSMAIIKDFPTCDHATEPLIEFAAEHGGTVPTNWNGVIPLHDK